MEGVKRQKLDENRLWRGRPVDKTQRPMRASWRHYYERNREKLKAKKRAYYASNPEKAMASMRRAYLLKRYGITLEQYSSLLEAQGGLCALCGEAPFEGRIMSVDHDHRTGVVRGILHNICNMGLGAFWDDPRRLRQAAEYLERGL